MNDTISLAADILTVLGTLLGITLELRRARREARRDSEPPQK
ncbi:hypothetical protein ACIRQY_20715 [Streptomyces sp. NPDC101490]